MPGLRASINRELQGRTLTRRRVLAGIVALRDATGIRIGNEEYVVQNGSFGLSTLRDRHVKVARSAVELCFVGKGGARRQTPISDKKLVRFLKQARRAGRQVISVP